MYNFIKNVPTNAYWQKKFLNLLLELSVFFIKLQNNNRAICTLFSQREIITMCYSLLNSLLNGKVIYQKEDWLQQIIETMLKKSNINSYCMQQIILYRNVIKRYKYKQYFSNNYSETRLHLFWHCTYSVTLCCETQKFIILQDLSQSLYFCIQLF